MNILQNFSPRAYASSLSLFAFVPYFAYAQVATPTDFRSLVGLFLSVISGLISLSWVALFVLFVYGVFRFLTNFENEKEREEGKKFMVWSIVATAITLMIWGILNLLSNSVFGSSIGIPVLTPPSF